MFQGVLGISKIKGFAFKEKFPPILTIDAEQTFHQGGLACTIFPHEGVDGTSFYLQVHILQDLDTGEGFAYAVHAQQIIFHGTYPLFDIKCRGRASALPRQEPLYTILEIYFY
jgi:hypothetical protein